MYVISVLLLYKEIRVTLRLDDILDYIQNTYHISHRKDPIKIDIIWHEVYLLRKIEVVIEKE